MGLIRFLAIVLLVYLLVRIVLRFVVPFALRLFFSRAQKKWQNQAHSQQNKKETIRDDGEVRIEYERDQHKSKTSSKGDYVDFEELE